MTARITTLALLLALCASATDVAWADGPTEAKKPKTEFLYMRIADVKTGAAAAAIQAHVTRVRGVKSFAWTTPMKEAKVVRIVGLATNSELVAACRAGGGSAAWLPVVQHRLMFAKKLHCNGCVLKVNRALKATKGVKEYAVSEDRLSVAVVYDAKQVSIDQLKAAVGKTGYKVKSVS